MFLRKKGSKYKNQKITYHGIKFDSKRECERYKELKLLEKAKKIKDLRLQVKYTLIPKQLEKNKVIERECSYIADFVYFDNELKQEVVEDTKGMKTDVYKLKKKLMLYIYGIKIVETK